MTVLCRGATSSIKPGAPTTLAVGATFISEALSALGPTGWALAALVTGYTVNISGMCATDPPPMPTWDANDVLSFAVGTLNPGWDQTLPKLDAVVNNYAWQLFCKCDDAQPPTAIAPVPSPPNTTVPAPTGPQPCGHGSHSGIAPNTPNTPPDSLRQDITTLVLPTTGATRIVTDASGQYTIYGMPTGVTSVVWTIQYGHLQSCGPDHFTDVFMHTYDSTGAPIQSFAFNETNPIDVNKATGTYTFTGSPVYWRLSEANIQATSCGSYTTPHQLVVDVWCGGATPRSLTSCCPPDESISLALNNIITVVNKIYANQKPSPSAWKDGTRHTGLSGSGRLNLSAGALGVRTEFTSIPSTVRVTNGDPTFYWDLGFLTPLAVEDPLRGWRTVFNPESFALPAFADGIAWTLAPGAVMNLVELIDAASP